MAKRFTVVGDNARRVIISANPNDTVFVMVKAACSKLGVEPDGRTLRHHKTELSLDAVLRHTTLPNQATLELVQLTGNKAGPAPVQLAVQLENRQRLKLDVDNSLTLRTIVDLVQEHHPAPADGSPVFRYLRRELAGPELALTLQEVGIAGRALISLNYASPAAATSEASS
ncbi:uncharacterized protein MONBRDRAFT_35544, partial [Monosiga brevicollis MX1]